MLLLLATLFGCAALVRRDPQEQTVATEGSTEQEHIPVSTEGTIETVQSEQSIQVDRFLRNFSTDYPEFRLLEYIIGSEENDPIFLVGIGENQETAVSSTLFFVHGNGVGTVTLAYGQYASYREEDGFRLEGNGISFSLNVECDTGFEIHDYTVTAHKEENDSLIGYGIVYTNYETIREEQ